MWYQLSVWITNITYSAVNNASYVGKIKKVLVKLLLLSNKLIQKRISFKRMWPVHYIYFVHLWVIEVQRSWMSPLDSEVRRWRKLSVRGKKWRWHSHTSQCREGGIAFCFFFSLICVILFFGLLLLFSCISMTDSITLLISACYLLLMLTPLFPHAALFWQSGSQWTNSS